MRITVALRAHLVSKSWAKADATDAEIKSIVAAKLVSDELTTDELTNLTKEAPAAGQTTLATFAKSLEQLQASNVAIMSELAAVKAGRVNAADATTATATVDDAKAIEQRLLEHATKAAAFTAANTNQNSNNNGNANSNRNTSSNRMSPEELLSKAHNMDSSIDPSSGMRVEVIKAVDRYDTSRKSLTYPAVINSQGVPHGMAGRQVVYQGRQLDSRSQRDKACIAAWLKYDLLRKGHNHPLLKMTDHDVCLVQWTLRNCEFVGGYGGDPDSSEGCRNIVERRKLTEYEVKMFDPANLWTKAPLIDDGTSGGSDLVPVEFDDAVITTPLLFGQLFPYVEVVDISRGSVIQGGSIGNVTYGYTAEGTQITPFDATGLVGAFNNTVYPAVAALSIGRDFQQDSPANIGQLVMDGFGRASMNFLDNVIATGNGSNQPQGILTFATPINVMAENPVSGPLTVSDYEAVKFAIPLEYREAVGGGCVFLSNDTTYSRAVGIPVGSDDARRVFGMAHDYKILGWPNKVNSTVGNNQLAAVNLGGYRLYRRLGMTTTIVRDGYTATLTNMDTIVSRMRWAGKMKLSNYVAVISNLQN